VETGNADAGFVALSLVLSPRLKDKGRWREIDAALHSPLDQGAVITKRGGSNPAAARFLTFLRGPSARTVFERFGYRVPGS
jgi:molybdate transport system substrate-binding protein